MKWISHLALILPTNLHSVDSPFGPPRQMDSSYLRSVRFIRVARALRGVRVIRLIHYIGALRTLVSRGGQKHTRGGMEEQSLLDGRANEVHGRFGRRQVGKTWLGLVALEDLFCSSGDLESVVNTSRALPSVSCRGSPAPTGFVSDMCVPTSKRTDEKRFPPFFSRETARESVFMTFHDDQDAQWLSPRFSIMSTTGSLLWTLVLLVLATWLQSPWFFRRFATIMIHPKASNNH